MSEEQPYYPPIDVHLTDSELRRARADFDAYKSRAEINTDVSDWSIELPSNGAIVHSEPPRPNTTYRVSEKYGRPPDKDVAKRRKVVKRLWKKNLSNEEISAKLHDLQRAGKLPEGLPINPDNVKSDIRLFRKGK